MLNTFEFDKHHTRRIEAFLCELDNRQRGLNGADDLVEDLRGAVL